MCWAAMGEMEVGKVLCRAPTSPGLQPVVSDCNAMLDQLEAANSNTMKTPH